MLEGNPAHWLAHFRTLEERLIDSVETVWPLCIAPLQADKDSLTHEDYITNHLVKALIRGKAVPGRFVVQYSLLSLNERQQIGIDSRIDFVLTIGDDEEAYLACECKRLNVPYKTRTRPLAYEYVHEGLARFVTGQYSNGLPLAMMIGYVMDAKVALAHDRLNRAIKRSIIIGLKSSDHSQNETGKPVRFVTRHQCATGHDIEVRHTLLGWP